MTPSAPLPDAQRRDVEEFTKAARRILAQRGVYGGPRPAALAWLLAFVQDDLTTYSFGEWSDRWAEVKRFSIDAGLGQSVVPLSNQESRSFPGPGEKDAMLTLQQVMKGDIDAYVNQGAATTFALKIRLHLRKDAPRVIVQSANREDSFQFQAFHLLADIGARIRRCRRCQRLFLAGRSDKEFCSGNCQALQYKREHPLKKTKPKPKGKRLRKGGARHGKR
jgi:hypothetical protein